MVDPRLALLILAVMGLVWVGDQIKHGADVVGHKTKCGVMRVVGKHCDAPKEPRDTP